VGCWSTKAAISRKSVKIDEKLLWRSYRNSRIVFRTVPLRTPYGLPFPTIGLSQRNLKLQLVLSQQRGKLRTTNLADTFTGSMIHRNKRPSKIWEKSERGRIQGLPKFFQYPLISQNWVKLRSLNFCTHIHRIVRKKSALKILPKVAMDVLSESRNFEGTYIYRAHRAIIFAVAPLSCCK